MSLRIRQPWRLPAYWPVRWAIPLFALAMLIFMQARVPEWAERAELWLVDSRFQARGTETPATPIVIVALDEPSFQTMGDLQGENIRTWPRARWAELVEIIAAGEPRVIALDIVLDTPGWDAGGDQDLADTLSQSNNVVLASNLQLSEAGDNAYLTYSPPVSALETAATGTGIATLSPDIDGAIRNAHLLWAWNSQFQPSFALVVANLYSGEAPNIPKEDLGSGLSLPIRYRGPEGTFQTISLVDVWEGETDPKVFREAIVLVGYTTQLEQDRHITPFGSKKKFPGVEIQASIVDMLLSGDWLHRPPAWTTSLAMLLLGILALILVNLPRPVLGVALFSAALGVYLAAGFLAFIQADFLVPLAAPVITAAITAGAGLTGRMVFAEQDKRRLRQRFAGVMSPERLQAVMDNWEALLKSDRPRKEAAVLFADVRGFTNCTETLLNENRGPEMVRFLSAYLDAMEDAIFPEGGVIFDVVGDGLMILFGLPESFEDYALRAVRAAVNMAKATDDLQAVWPLHEVRPLQIGIGIHCGPVVDAIVGRGRRFNYQVIGDPVNTTARIESHCKQTMTIPRPAGGDVPENVTILISQPLYEQVQSYILADESIPPFEARGKSKPLRVVRVLGLKKGE